MVARMQRPSGSELALGVLFVVALVPRLLGVLEPFATSADEWAIAGQSTELRFTLPLIESHLFVALGFSNERAVFVLSLLSGLVTIVLLARAPDRSTARSRLVLSRPRDVGCSSEPWSR